MRDPTSATLGARHYTNQRQQKASPFCDWMKQTSTIKLIERQKKALTKNIRLSTKQRRSSL
jgi:hypothetical protein